MIVNWPALYGGIGLIAALALAKIGSIEGRFGAVARWGPPLALVCVGVAASQAGVLPAENGIVEVWGDVLFRRDTLTLLAWGAVGAVVRWAPPCERGAGGAFVGGLVTGGLPMAIALASSADRRERTGLAAWALAGGLLSPLGPFTALLGLDAFRVLAPLGVLLAAAAAVAVRPDAPRLTRAGYGAVAGAAIGMFDPLAGLLLVLAASAAGPTRIAPPAWFMLERAALGVLAVGLAHVAGTLWFGPVELLLASPASVVVVGVSAAAGVLLDGGASALLLARALVVEPELVAYVPAIVLGAAIGTTLLTLSAVALTKDQTPPTP